MEKQRSNTSQSTKTRLLHLSELSTQDSGLPYGEKGGVRAARGKGSHGAHRPSRRAWPSLSSSLLSSFILTLSSVDSKYYCLAFIFIF